MKIVGKLEKKGDSETIYTLIGNLQYFVQIVAFK